ncbi:hypothetical protein CTheo_5595 [Ceratobasidium theobromae]|uniref:Uncharacterized protein n=1 Tax=Ceratobasidium theobromae TaxID=1582974 RepID=A0A5N5QH04_9AGAM|nr:hypothetical protein CTheo_5595 [Ceratobasidium theobromae]
MEHRPSPQPMGNNSASTSSSSVPSISTATTEDRTRTLFSTSPSGRVTFIFPQLHKQTSRPTPKAVEPKAPLVLLPTVADIIPSSETSPSEGGRIIVGPPNRLRLVTDDALTSMLGRSTNHAPSIYAQGKDSIRAWVESSKQATRGASHERDESETS